MSILLRLNVHTYVWNNFGQNRKAKAMSKTLAQYNYIFIGLVGRYNC